MLPIIYLTFPATSKKKRRAVAIRTSSVSRLCAIALCAALLAPCAWLTVPAPVPFTLQTAGVFFSVCFLGPWDGTAAIAVYLLLGLVGLPVFVGFQGGPAVFLGPTGGFLLGFLTVGPIYGLLGGGRRSPGIKALLLFMGLLVCYLVGSVWYACLFAKGTGVAALGTAFTVCALPFLIPDGMKLLLALFLTQRVRKSKRPF